MKLFQQSDRKPRRGDHKIAEQWPGPWIGFYVGGSRVTSKSAGRKFAYELAKQATEHCGIPVIVLYRGPQDWMSTGSFYDPVGGNDMWCMWPASGDAGSFLHAIGDMLRQPHIGWGLIHHSVHDVTWEEGLIERFGATQGVTIVYRSNWS